MPVKTLSKHELKTQETRKLLLEAAEQIFARDGYEGAELGEIAARAGRTKGAIYAQFKSKEDVFLALAEDRREYYRHQMAELLAKSSSIEENLESFRQFYLTQVVDPTWALLFLEFKLFANRHSKVRKRLHALFSESFSVDAEKRYAEIIGPADKRKNALSRVLAVQFLTPLLAAAVLEARASYPPLEEKVVKTIAEVLFDAFLQIEPSKGRAPAKTTELQRRRNATGAKTKTEPASANGSLAAV